MRYIMASYKLHFSEMIMIYPLYYTNTLSWIFMHVVQFH